MTKDRIAIIGIGCRFPGNVHDTESFWKLLVEGREAVSEVPADRWNIERFYDPEPGIAGKTFAKRGGFLDQIDQFDPQFFGISPREAPYVDPQQRLLLETAWEAIEHAGLVLDFEKGTDIGVFVGISHNDYQGIQSIAHEHSGISPHSPTGSAHSIAANRISYCLNLQRPERRHGHGVLVGAHGRPRGVRAHPRGARRHGARRRRDGHDHARRVHRVFAGWHALARGALRGLRGGRERLRAG